MTESEQDIPAGLRERAAGCLVGAALGDAFGMPLEFGPPPAVQVREFRAGPLPAGSFTDDTEMMLALAGSLLAQRTLDLDDLVARFLYWLRRGPDDVGIQTRAILGHVQAGMPWKQAVAHIQEGKPDSMPNGSVMRCFPVALSYWDDLEGCLETSRRQSLVTHPHPECLAACAFVNAAIWYGLRGADAATAVEQALGGVPDMPAALRGVIEGAAQQQTADLRNTGSVRHTVESAVWGLLTTDSYEEAVIRVANLGNDADTAAAVAGAMAGAVYGLEGIPAEWRGMLRGQWPIHSGQMWGATEFIFLANALLDRERVELETIPQRVAERR